MSSPAAATWLRRVEIGLWVLGIGLLGGALAAVGNSRIYQARQRRAFFAQDRAAAVPTRPALALPERDPLVIGRVEIPRIGVDAMVRDGEDDATLAVAVGRIPGTARPGERGNMGLAGHRDSFFRALERIELDDTVVFRAAGRRDEYRVDSIEVVGPEQVDVLDPTPDAVLTLVTCYPFVWTGSAPKRFVVRARLARAPLRAAPSPDRRAAPAPAPRTRP